MSQHFRSWRFGDFRQDRFGNSVSPDGRIAVRVTPNVAGRRGFYDAVMQLAVFLSATPSAQRGCLVLKSPRMSRPRIEAEWSAARGLFAAAISSRLALVVIQGDESWQSPQDALNRDIADLLAGADEEVDADRAFVFRIRNSPGQKFYEVFKVLLCRWLQREAPLPLGRLAATAGCSYPTLRAALSKHSLRPSLRFESNRAVALDSFPHAAWNELVAMSGSIRPAWRFADRTGGRPDPESLLQRLSKLAPRRVAFGGVPAARHWHPDFNLHGTPRLDLTCHAPAGEADLRFVKKLDPALALTDDPRSSAILVVHAVTRSAPQWTPRTNSPIAWSDPVETALDLCELRLAGEANQLINFLRPEARLA